MGALGGTRGSGMAASPPAGLPLRGRAPPPPASGVSHRLCRQVVEANGYDGRAAVGVAQGAVRGVDRKERPPLREEARLRVTGWGWGKRGCDGAAGGREKGGMGAEGQLCGRGEGAR